MRIHILKVYRNITLKMTLRLQRLIARHALTNTVGHRLLNATATRREEAEAVAASLRDFRLT